jgi:hypothetical protein
MTRAFALVLVVSLIGHAIGMGLPLPNTQFLFRPLTCATCEGVLGAVHKQIPNAAGISLEALKQIVEGTCAYFTLGISRVIPVCSMVTTPIVNFLLDDVMERTKTVLPKSNCRAIGMCPPCKPPTTHKKFVCKLINQGDLTAFLVARRPNLPLPWDLETKHLHREMVAKVKAEAAMERMLYSQRELNHIMQLPAPQQKALLDDVKCYACKAIMGQVGHKVTNLKESARDVAKDMIIGAIEVNKVQRTRKHFQAQCKTYAGFLPYGKDICEYMVENTLGHVADDILGHAKVRPAENCRTLGRFKDA